MEPRIGPWRALALLGMGAALGAGMVAMVLLGAAGGPPVPGLPPAAAPPARVATLAPSGEAPAVRVRLDREDGALLVRVTLAAAQARVPELWLIPGEGPGAGVPRSLGVLAEEGEALRVPIERLGGVLPRPGDALALSLEPPGGSSTGAPTGPVVAAGPLLEL